MFPGEKIKKKPTIEIAEAAIILAAIAPESTFLNRVDSLKVQTIYA